jgi:hypothetical protein
MTREEFEDFIHSSWVVDDSANKHSVYEIRPMIDFQPGWTCSGFKIDGRHQNDCTDATWRTETERINAIEIENAARGEYDPPMPLYDPWRWTAWAQCYVTDEERKLALIEDNYDPLIPEKERTDGLSFANGFWRHPSNKELYHLRYQCPNNGYAPADRIWFISRFNKSLYDWACRQYSTEMMKTNFSHWHAAVIRFRAWFSQNNIDDNDLIPFWNDEIPKADLNVEVPVAEDHEKTAAIRQNRKMRGEIAKLRKGKRLKLGEISDSELEEIADNTRKRNGKINYTAMGKVLGCDADTVKQQVIDRNLAHLIDPPPS